MSYHWDHQNVKNLANLADIYLQAGRKSRAEVMMEEAEKYEPQNRYSRHLKKLVAG